MSWQVEYTDEFGEWWDGLSEAEQASVNASIKFIEEFGPTLEYPRSSKVAHSRYSHMRELRVQHQGQPYRILYAFDPKRMAILLIGGKKTGQDSWYEVYIPRADELYEEHLRALTKEETKWRKSSQS